MAPWLLAGRDGKLRKTYSRNTLLNRGELVLDQVPDVVNGRGNTPRRRSGGLVVGTAAALGAGQLMLKPPLQSTGELKVVEPVHLL
eukprot:6666921-Pyramimonas_sp.AAC.1